MQCAAHLSGQRRVPGGEVHAVPTLASRHQIGDEDVARMRAKLDALTSLDQSRGGHNALETAAITGADNTLDMNKASASQRVHRELLALAADFTATAAFSALDNHRLDQAEQYLNNASSLAAMSQDRPVEIRVLVNTAMLHHHRGNQPAALAAAEATMWKAAHHGDPFYSSLTHTRLAVAHADAADRQAALRSLGNATANTSAASTPRPNAPPGPRSGSQRNCEPSPRCPTSCSANPSSQRRPPTRRCR